MIHDSGTLQHLNKPHQGPDSRLLQCHDMSPIKKFQEKIIVE